MDTNMKELNMNEMEKVVGGGPNDGGYAKKPATKDGCFIYKVQSGDRLGQIARTYNTTVKAIMRVNPELVSEDFIVTNHYIYIPLY